MYAFPRNPVGSWWPYPENRTLGSSLGTPLVPGDHILRTAPSVLPLGTPLVPGDHILRTAPSVLPLGTPLVPGDRILTPSPNTSHLVFRGFLKSADPHCLFFCHLLDSYILSISAVCGRMPALRRHPNSVVLFYLPNSCILEIPVFCGSPLSVAGYPRSTNIQILLFCGLSDSCVLRIPVFRGSPLSV